MRSCLVKNTRERLCIGQLTFLMSFYCWQEEIAVSVKQNISSATLELTKGEAKKKGQNTKFPFSSLTNCQAQLTRTKYSLGKKTHTYVFSRKVHLFPSQQITIVNQPKWSLKCQSLSSTNQSLVLNVILYTQQESRYFCKIAAAFPLLEW